ncbi:hypothetical protein HDE_10016 [Halotydeus destructor]|nr:hypothetical protein HDE_10016 [Halotydeus destructor]
MTAKLIVIFVVLVSCCCHGGQAVMDCEVKDAEAMCNDMETALDLEDPACKKCRDSGWKNSAGADSAATPASAPGWMDDDDSGYQPRGRRQNNYGKPNYGRKGYGGNNGNGYGNGYGNGGHSNGGYSNGGYNGYDNGYGDDDGYSQMSSNMNYRPPVQNYNMGYGGRYRK